MSSKKEEKSQAAAERIKAAALSAAKGLSRAQAERAAARNVNAHGQKEEGPRRWQEKREAERPSKEKREEGPERYLMSTEKTVKLGERKDLKPAMSASGRAAQCKQCFQSGHWTYECKNERRLDLVFETRSGSGSSSVAGSDYSSESSSDHSSSSDSEVAFRCHKNTASEGRRHEKKEDHKSSRRDSDRSSSRRSLKRLRPSTTAGDCSATMDFLNHRVMISNRVMIELGEPEKGPYTSSSAAELNNAFLELSSRTLLVGWIMGEVLKKDAEDVEKVKKDLAESSSSLKAALSANISLAANNKTLEEQNEKLKAGLNLFRERCLIAKRKEVDANKRASDLREKIVDLERRNSALEMDLGAERGRRADMELTELQDYAIEQYDLGFSMALKQAAFFYDIPLDEGKMDPRKAFYKGKLVPVEDIPDEEEDEERVASSGVDIL